MDDFKVIGEKFNFGWKIKPQGVLQRFSRKFSMRRRSSANTTKDDNVSKGSKPCKLSRSHSGQFRHLSRPISALLYFLAFHEIHEKHGLQNSKRKYVSFFFLLTVMAYLKALVAESILQ